MYFKYKMEYVWFPVNALLFWRVMNEIIVKSLYPESIYDFFAWLFFAAPLMYMIFHVIGFAVISSCVYNKLKIDISNEDVNYIMYKITFFILIWLCVFHYMSLDYV